MDHTELINKLAEENAMSIESIVEKYSDEVYIEVKQEHFLKICLGMHKKLNSPVMMFFADKESPPKSRPFLYCVFLGRESRKWFFIKSPLPEGAVTFKTLANDIYSAALFERQIKESFGLIAEGNPDLRSLVIHEEVNSGGEYSFKRVEGEGIFEVPVGPVHAGIIGPGHFRFSVAGEPIINLEIRLGFTHKATEKLFEGKRPEDVVSLCECIAGDSAFSYSLAFCRAMEKIRGITVAERDSLSRAVFLELERMYNHVADIGGMALDVGFTFPSALASIIKENILQINEKLTGSRYLKNVNRISESSRPLSGGGRKYLLHSMAGILDDFRQLKSILSASVSFMDRVDTTGTLKKKTAEDIGVVGMAARASGIPVDLRAVFEDVYASAAFKPAKEEKGDCLARLNVRFFEFEESARLIEEFIKRPGQMAGTNQVFETAQGCALGYVENWRGPLLFWVKINAAGIIERVRIVDASFHNWQGLSFAVLGDIVPDFPLCNKSFNLSYPGNDL